MLALVVTLVANCLQASPHLVTEIYESGYLISYGDQQTSYVEPYLSIGANQTRYLPHGAEV